MSKPYRRKDSKFWWIAPWIGGRQVRQSSGETEYDRAVTKLKILEGKIASGSAITPTTDRESFGALLDMVEIDYAKMKRRSIGDLKRRIKKHLRPVLGHLRSAKVTSDVIDRYILERQAKASDASVNREIAIIKRAFRLGKRAGRVSDIPFIEDLPEDNVRQDFFRADHFDTVLTKSNPLLYDVLTTAYRTGWRIASILTLEWRQVDFQRGLVSLDANQTKTRKAAFCPLAVFPDLKTALERRHAETKAIEKKLGMVVARVFNRKGVPVKSIRTAWENTRERAGVPARLIHDLKRTAVRNYEALGFSETEIMHMVGIKSRSIFTRYNITTMEDILAKGDAVAKRRVSQ